MRTLIIAVVVALLAPRRLARPAARQHPRRQHRPARADSIRIVRELEAMTAAGSKRRR